MVAAAATATTIIIPLHVAMSPLAYCHCHPSHFIQLHYNLDRKLWSLKTDTINSQIKRFDCLKTWSPCFSLCFLQRNGFTENDLISYFSKMLMLI